ncbi:MBL fold metallo-hydrolase [Halococcus salsus]|uniref:MBL fold metallo-hydrolase n=1 Tax=Halococcus salsus TaxID=2162894 RepID=UPI001358ADB8|nr:MBL fold metallo-hydrolase [Halococcus salsus]
MTEIHPDVHDITVREGNGRFRVFLVDGDTPTLFDCGLADTVDALAAGIEEVGIDPERLVVTHGDGDHVGGFDEVVERYGVETFVPAETDLDTEHDPDHRYGDGDRIGSFEAVHVPGHTEDNHVLVDESRDVAVMGDAVFGSDVRGLPAGYFVLPTAFYSTDLNAADENLERLLDYEFDAGLVYHGSSVTDEAAEKLDAFVNFANKPD